MSDPRSRATSWTALALCAALAVASLFLHPDAGPGGLPLKYPLLGAGAAAALVAAVRLLRPLLCTRDGGDHAD